MSDSRPKLLLFSHLCSPVNVTGAEKVLLLFVRELMRRFHCVLVVPQEGALSEQARGIGIRVIVMDLPRCPSIYDAPPSTREEADSLVRHPSWAGLLSMMAWENPSYIWVNTCVHLMPAMAAKCLGIPVVWNIHETITDTPNRQTSADLITAHADIIAGVSDTVLSPLKGSGSPSMIWFPPFLYREELLPAGWAIKRARFRTNLGWSEEHRVAGVMAAHFQPFKGLEPFVSSMLKVAESIPHARFLIAGNPIDQAHYEACRQAVAHSGMSDRFAWLGYVENVHEIIPAVDAIVVPSLVAEGFGMTALEGMFFEKPVVAFASGGLTELMSTTGNAELLVPVGDTEALAERVRTLFADEGRLRLIGLRCSEEAERQFGADAFRARVDSLIAMLPPARPFPPSFLIRGSGPTIYLLENGKKCPFQSVHDFRSSGYSFNQVVVVNDDLLNRIEMGSPIGVVARRPRRQGRAKPRRRLCRSRPGRRCRRAATGKSRRRSSVRSRRGRGQGRRKSIVRRRSKSRKKTT
ncbi:glycosyltransferase family 4 protein [Cohnella faecalis]|uniref:Glycosyltransferase n=1 Tax=Cohnella faecalis TaxID=2315694 RepID=A0A398CNN8_9BACL|nr:glycosyltransferase family 4 protein [Cohnella faecalis]RIE02869.1 glycosyltransferase [Cohnella faecalis]